MKLIKAFVRTTRLDNVVHALRDAGAPGVTVSRGHGIGYGYKRFDFTLASGEVSHAPEVGKIEVVCQDQQVTSLVDAVLAEACTNCAGDGILFVSPVEQAVRIRRGETGDDALRPATPDPPTGDPSPGGSRS
ncbi:MAG: P-II family nitrogen regulator [Acidobacteriota bacterium]